MFLIYDQTCTFIYRHKGAHGSISEHSDVYMNAHMHLKNKTCSPIMWAQNCLWPLCAAKSSDLNKQHPIKRWKQTRLRPGQHCSQVCAAQRHNVLVQVEVKARMRCSIDVSHDSPEIRLSAVHSMDCISEMKKCQPAIWPPLIQVVNKVFFM